MEKAKIFDIQRYCVDDGAGIRTTVFFKNCPLRCKWCHNPEGVTENYRYADGKPICKEMSVNEIFDEIIKDKEYYLSTGGGVTLSGGEVALWADFALKLLLKCKNAGINSVVETSGYCSESDFATLIKCADTVYFDIKLLDKNEFKNYTGGRLEVVLNALDYLCSTDKNIVLRCPVIGGVNDNEEYFNSLIRLINEHKNIAEIHLLPYHDLMKNKYKKCGLNYDKKFCVPTEEVMKKARQTISKETNVKVRYLDE